jgi:hypothetical protein
VLDFVNLFLLSPDPPQKIFSKKISPEEDLFSSVSAVALLR